MGGGGSQDGGMGGWDVLSGSVGSMAHLSCVLGRIMDRIVVV